MRVIELEFYDLQYNDVRIFCVSPILLYFTQGCMEKIVVDTRELFNPYTGTTIYHWGLSVGNFPSETSSSSAFDEFWSTDVDLLFSILRRQLQFSALTAQILDPR